MSLAILWVTIACTKGYGGLVTRFLSWGFFQVINHGIDEKLIDQLANVVLALVRILFERLHNNALDFFRQSDFRIYFSQ